ncbi:MAG: G5 domain-containing protein [Mogibacterium sp.]|nr:G5 domain-containing protein [Mogibacterium sp.]
MADKKKSEVLKETIQLERAEIREKIRELIESEYARLEAEAERIAPEFDYESEAEKLKAEEAEELAKIDFAWVEDKAEEVEAAEVMQPAESTAAAEAGAESQPEPEEEAAPPAEPEAKAEKEYRPLPPAKVSKSKYPKPPRVYKSAAAQAMFGDRHKRVFSAAVLMLAFFAAYQAWDYLVPKNVNIDYMTYEGTDHIEYATTARTVGDMMDELTEGGSAGNDVKVSATDLLDTGEDMPVSNGMTVGIRHASEADAKIEGKEQKLWLVPGTVEENLTLNEISFDGDDEIKPALNKQVDDDTKIVLNEIHYDVKEKTEKVEAQDKVILDPSLTSGVQETTEGNDGEGVFTYTTKYVNGKKKGTDREVKEWITEPHDNTLRLGTSSTGTEGEYLVTRTFTANTTAYTAKAGARGALGMGVHVGTCAVDPGFVSLRSELWVEGYGYAYANDTGGAVKGNVVDLYMNSRGQCISWGRRNVTAYVITPAE